MPNYGTPPPRSLSALARDRTAILGALKEVPPGERWAIAIAPALARLLQGQASETGALFVGNVPIVLDPSLSPFGWELRRLG